MKRVFLDTTVLVYAMGRAHPLRADCLNILRANASGQIEAQTTPTVIQEFVQFYAQRKPRKDAVRLGKDFMEVLTLVNPGHVDTEEALSLFAKYRLAPSEATLVATAISSEASALVSADKRFHGIPGLTWWTPQQCLQEAYPRGDSNPRPID